MYAKSGPLPAKNLKDAYNALDARKAVEPKEVPALFVERPCADTTLMRAAITASSQPRKFLFIGHRGSGKSSELSYLATLLQTEFHCVRIPLFEIIPSTSCSHGELILAMNLRLFQAASDAKLIPKGKLDDVWVKYIKDRYQNLYVLLLGEAAEGQKALQSAKTIKLNAHFIELEKRFGTDFSSRADIRNRLEGRITEMIKQIGDVVSLLEDALNKKLVLFVEDLDKFDLECTKDLFLGHAQTLSMPRVHVVYSFQVSMRYMQEFPAIRSSFDGVYTLPNISLKDRKGTDDADGIGTARRILGRRLDENLFEPGVIEETIRLSGGHVKTLIRLAQEAVLNAIVENRETIRMENLALAASKLRDDYIVLLKKDQIDLLRKFRDDSDKELAGVGEAIQELLFTTSLLEYGNTHGPWGGVNPIVEEILDRQDQK